MGNLVGDMAYPDNPNRRKRASELHDDVVAFGAQFQKLYNNRAQIVASLKGRVDALLQKFDIATPEKLSVKLNAALNSEQMQRYRDLKSKLDSSDDFVTILSGLVDIGAVASGVVITGLAIASVITAGAALAAAGEIIAVLGAIVAVVGVLEGVHERNEMRKSIRELFPKRQQVKQALEQLNVVVDWMKTIEIWVDTLSASNSATVDTLVNEMVKESYDKWTEEYTKQKFAEYDASRNSWTDEDPPKEYPPDVIEVPDIIDIFHLGGFGAGQEVSAEQAPEVKPFQRIEALEMGLLLDKMVF